MLGAGKYNHNNVNIEVLLMFLQLKKIRNKLLKEGKLGKYIFYAIGEIFLVVIGILIALQVNNYNVKRKDKLVEFQYYQTIKVQLIEDRELLNNEAYNLTGRIDDYAAGMTFIIDNKRQQLSELGGKVLRLLEYGDFRRKSSVYQTLIYSGEVTHIKNHIIKSNLQELERTYQLIERLEATQGNLVMAHTAPAIIDVVDFETGQLVSTETVFTQTFKNRFSVAIRLANEKKGEFEHALLVIENTLNAIEAELNKQS